MWLFFFDLLKNGLDIIWIIRWIESINFCVCACECVCMCCHHVWLAAIQVNNCSELNQIGWSTDRHRQNIASNVILTMKSCESLNPLQEETFEKPSDEKKSAKFAACIYDMYVVRSTTRTHTQSSTILFA